MIVAAVAGGTAAALLIEWGGLAWPLALGACAVLATLTMWLASLGPAASRDGGRTDGSGEAASRAGGTDSPWSALLVGIPDAAFILDRTGAVVATNAAAIALFPLEKGRNLSLAARSPELLQATSNALTTNEPQHCTVRLVPPREQVLDGRVTPFDDGDGRAGKPAVLIVLRDTTEQEQLSRMRADFVANASHELRTPLTSLKGFVETLQGAAKDDPVAREKFLGIMRQQAERMSRLIEDLLSLSRIEMREHVTPSGAVDIAAIAVDAARALTPQAEQSGISIEIAAGDAPKWVTGDRDELAQVVNNLVQNAIKYGRKGGRVTIETRAEGDRIRLDVTDDGIGIAPEHVPRLTERFYRVSAKESRERGGTGLGLAIVKHIVNRHRGQLVIRSTPGAGSTFSVLLPATTAHRNF